MLLHLPLRLRMLLFPLLFLLLCGAPLLQQLGVWVGEHPGLRYAVKHGWRAVLGGCPALPASATAGAAARLSGKLNAHTVHTVLHQAKQYASGKALEFLASLTPSC